MLSKLSAGECDLYLGCDLLVAADPTHLTAASADRTIAVLSTSEVPTGRMVSDVTAGFPDAGALAAEVTSRSRSSYTLDASELAQGLFGDGSVRLLPNSLSLQVLYNLCNRDDGNTTGDV